MISAREHQPSIERRSHADSTPSAEALRRIGAVIISVQIEQRLLCRQDRAHRQIFETAVPEARYLLSNLFPCVLVDKHSGNNSDRLRCLARTLLPRRENRGAPGNLSPDCSRETGLSDSPMRLSRSLQSIVAICPGVARSSR